MKRAIREHFKDFAAIIGLLIVAGAVAGVVLTNQRFRFPIITPKPTTMYAELRTAQAVTPGQGQTVEVAGVKIGLIKGVKLRDGRGIIKLEIKDQYKDLLHTDASALLRPRTGLKDMFLQVNPGSPKSPVAKKGFTIPASSTLTDVNLDEILATLDVDTREHLQLLLVGADVGLKQRGMDLAELFRRFGLTARDLRRVNQAVATERESIKDAVHGLSLLTNELAGKNDDLAQLVAASSTTFRALASEDSNLAATVHKLPQALRTTTRTLGDVRRFADELKPTASSLRPVFTALNRSNKVVTPTARRLTPVLRDQIRPFTREARPLVADLRPAAKGLSGAFPDVTTVGLRVNHLLNLLAFNPQGREPADKAGRQEGYLFWLAWLVHQTANLQNIDDANGPMRPVFLTGTCQTLTNLVDEEPLFEFAMGISDLLAGQCANPPTLSVDIPGVTDLVKKQGKAFDRAKLKARKEAGK